jgi:hypothetical protein
MDYDSTGLLLLVSSENENIENEINKIEDNDTTNNQIISYKNEQSSWFQSVNKILLFVYYLMVLVLMYIILISKKMSIVANIIIIVLLLTFPFVINSSEIMIYNLLKYIWTFIMCTEYQ